MPDFSYLDSSGIGQIETPFQQPKTLPVNGPDMRPQVDFSQLDKATVDTGPHMMNDMGLDPNVLKNSPKAPRAFDADRLAPYRQSGAYKDIGYNPDMPEQKTQAEYDYDQSNWEAAWSSTKDLFKVSASSFLNYYKTYGNTIKALVNSNQQGIMYNEQLQDVKDQQEDARTNLRFKGDIPMRWYNYIPLPGLMKGDVAEELLPQLGFTLGTGAAAAIENLGVSLLTGGAGEPAEATNTASKLYKLISEYSSVGRMGEVAKTLYNGPVLNLRLGLDAARLTNATLSETSMDAAQNFVQHKDKLIQDFIDKNGHAPGVGTDDMKKIDQNSHDMANATMWGEFPILAASNFIQYRNLLSPTIAKRLAEHEALQGMKIVNTAADKIGSEFAVQEPLEFKGLKAIGHVASHFAKNATSEGLEELFQNAVDNTVSNYYQKLYKDDKKASLMDSIFEVGIPNLADDDGLQNFMGGFVTGGLFHAFGSLGNKLGTKDKIFNAEGELTGYKDNILNKLGFGTEEIAKANMKNQLQTVVDVLNTEDLKSIFKEEGLADFVKSTQDSRAMNAALANQDLFNVGNLKSNALVRFLYTGMQTGKLDLRLSQLNEFRDLSQDKLNEFLGVDTGAVNKQTVGAVLDHIIGKAGQVKEMFDTEKDRFATQQSAVNRQFTSADNSHKALEQTLRTKYNLDPNEPDLRAPMIDLLSKSTEGTSEHNELAEDTTKLHESMINRNHGLIHAMIVREGTKAAIFAAANMNIDSERSKEIIRSLHQSHPSYLDLENSLHLTQLDTKIKELSSQVKAMTGVDSEAALKAQSQLDKAIGLKSSLLAYYEIPMPGKAVHAQTANNLYNYLDSSNSPEEKAQRLGTKAAEIKSLDLLLKLEKRNRNNLSLYNTLTQSDKGFEEYSKQQTDRTARTIGKWTQEYLNKGGVQEETSVTSQTQPTTEQATTPQGVPLGEPPVQTQSSPVQTSLLDDKVAEIKQKVEAGQELAPEDVQTLNTAAVISQDASNTYDRYVATQAAKGEPVTQQTKSDEPTEVYKSETDKPTQEGYKPEPNTKVKADEVQETQRVQEHNGQVVENPNRTIVNQLVPGQFSKETPKLVGGYTAWKQNFFDYIAQNDFLDRYTGKLVVDSLDNYPEDSEQYKALQNLTPGLVLVITDKNGNDRFDANYLPDPKGQKIVHSMPNSPGKVALLGTLKASGGSVSVDFSNVSQGIFDQLDLPRSTSQLLEGISEADYQYIVAQGGLPEDPIYYQAGMALRNGGLYIKTAGSYIKLLPDFAGNLKVGDITNPNVYSLVGKQFATKEEALVVTSFLEKLFFTDKEKAGLQFSVYNDKGRFRVGARWMQAGKAVEMTQDQLAGAMRAERINIDKNSIGGTLRFLHVVDDKIQYVDVPYNDFLRNNTLTNKKAYETAEGKKVLKPVNRYLTFNRSLEDINNELKTPIPEVKTEEPKAEPNKEIIQEPKKTRRRFDIGKEEQKLPEKKDFLQPGFKFYMYDKDSRIGGQVQMQVVSSTEEVIDNRTGATNVLALVKNLKTGEERSLNVDDELDTIRQQHRFVQEKKQGPDFGDVDKLFSRKSGGQELTTPMQSERDWINQTFSQSDLATIKPIIDAGAWGTWSRSGIELLESAPKGTGYHEAWHHFSQLYLSPLQRSGLYSEVRSKIESLRDSSDLSVEEYVANDFKDYVNSGATKVLGNTPVRNTVFRRMYEFLRKLFTGRESLDRLYKNLYEGNLTRYKPSFTNAQFGKLNSKLVDAQGSELMDNQKSYRFLNHMESVAGQVLSNANISPAQFMTGDKDIDRTRALQLAKSMYTALAQQANDLADEIDAFEAKYPDGSTPLLETHEDLSKVLDNFMPVFRQYYLQSGYRSATISKEDVDDLDTDIEATESAEVSNAGKGWDVMGNEESTLDSASAETKALIRGLSRVQIDKNGDPLRVGGKVQLYRNEYGLNEPVNFIRTINNLGNLLEGSFSYQEMLDKINNKDNQQRIPELALLTERLPDITKDLKYTEVKQLLSFLKNFAKTYIPVYTLVKLRSGDFLFREETRRTQDVIERQWSGKFFDTPKNSPLVGNGTILYDENDRPYINPAINLDYNLQTTQGKKDFLSLLGININPRAEGTRDYEDATKSDKLGFVLQTLRQRLKAGQKIGNPVADLKKGFFVKGGGEIKSEKSTINALVAVEGKYTTENPSMSFRTATGNMQQGLSENNWITNNNYYLSRTQNYSQIVSNPNLQHLNIDNNPYIRHSLFLNKLFNLDPTSASYGQRRRVNGEPVVLEYGNYNGLEEEQEKGNNKGTSTVSLNPRDKLVMDMNSLMLQGATELMRTESSSSAFFLKLSDYTDQDGKVQNLPIPTQEMAGDVTHPKVLEYFRGVFMDELATIANKYNSELPRYISNIGKFTMFEGILGKGLRDSLQDQLGDMQKDLKMSPEEKQARIDKIMEAVGDTVDKQVGDFLQNEVKDFSRLLEERGVGFNDMSKSLTQGVNPLTMSSIIASFVVNDFILNSEFIKLFDGNVGFFKAYHKRAKGNTSTGIRAATDDFLRSYLEGTKDRTLAASLGANIETNLKQTKTVVFKDDVRKSKYTDGRDSLYKRGLRASGQLDAYTEALIDKAYGNMNVADGQGHATFDFYREMRMRVANWSFADEVGYQKEVIGFRERKGLYGTTVPEEQRAKDQKFLQDYAGTNSTYPPMKMQSNGALVMPGVFAPVLDKFSIMPLIPSVINGTVWDDKNDQLLKEGIGYTKFESGTKKYKWTPTDFYNDHEGYTASLADSPKAYNYATHTAESLKEQLKTSSEPKDEATWGTQMRKLFLTNLFNSGMSSDKFTSLYNRYIGILDKVQLQQKANLYKEFGIKEQGDQVVIQDVKGFVKTLQRQVNSQALNDNIKNFIQYDPNTKSFVYPLEVSLNKSQVQDLISGMVFNRLTHLKVNGDMLIQVASSGFEAPGFKYANATAEDNLKYGSNGLPFYEPTFNKDGSLGETKPMRVKVALIKEWTKLLNLTHTDGKQAGTIDRLNELLRDDAWREKNRKKITMIGYRIPTQGANSLEFMEIHEFLPSVAGSIVILPAEIVAKSGSDYDIDKMPIIRPSFTEDGELALESTDYEKQLDGIKKQVMSLYAKEKDMASTRTAHEYTEVDRLMDKMAYGVDAEEVENEIDGLLLDNDRIQELLHKYQRVASNRQGALTNQVIDIYKDVLSSPEMFKQLITPNNVDLVKSVAQEIAKLTNLAGFDKDGNTKEFTNTDVLKARSNNVKFEQLLSGKRDVAIFAKANTMSQLLQQAGMLLNTSYTLTTNKGDFNRLMTLTLFSPDERKALGASKVNEDGSITDKLDYSSNVDIGGQIYKQEYFSQLINGTVDVAGDPWYAGLRLHDLVKTALVHMINTGVPARRAILFLNHPAIQNYVNAVARLGQIEKWNIIQDAFGASGRKNTKARMLAMIEAIDTGKNYQNGFYFKEDELVQNIKDPKSAKDWYNRQVLAHFLKLDEQGKLVRSLQATVSFDTQKFLTPISAQSNLNLRGDVEHSNLFDTDAVNKMRDHSLVSPFNNVQKMIDIFEKIMPVGMNAQIIKSSAELMKHLSNPTKALRTRLERTLNNDWMEFIIKNYGDIGGMNFEKYAKDLIIYNGGNEVLGTELTRLKNTMPELRHYDVFTKLLNNVSEKSKGWRNIELRRGLDNSSDYQNVLIEEISQLQNFQGTEIPGKTFTPEQILEVRNFFTKLGYLAFQQSGFNKSALYFTDVIPQEELAPIFRQALNRFTQQVNTSDKLSETISQFIDKFKEQNPTFVFDNDQKPAKESFRGKLYRVGDIDPSINPTPTDYGEGGPSESNIDDMINNCS